MTTSNINMIKNTIFYLSKYQTKYFRLHISFAQKVKYTQKKFTVSNNSLTDDCYIIIYFQCYINYNKNNVFKFSLSKTNK